MTLKDLLEEVDTTDISCALDTEVKGICYDSRNAGEGQVFVAIKGYKTDGNEYAAAAIKNGCIAVVTEERSDSLPCICVPSARRAMAQLAAAFYGHPERALKLVGVTGTNGKTTSTYLIKQVLEKARGIKVGLIGTNQNMIGDELIGTERTTPESAELFALLAKMRDSGCTYAVMEVSSHSLMLDRVFGLHFSAAAFTNLTRDHLDFHGSMEEYALAKSRLFDVCDVGVVNIDDRASEVMMSGKACRFIKCSASKDEGDLVAKNVMLRADKVEFAAVVKNDISRASLSIPGMFSVQNALTAIGCCVALGLELEEITKALAGASGVRGRAEVVPISADFICLVDYAHTPDGMENIIKTARGFAKGRVITLFGCGGNRDKTKRPIMGKMGAANSDICVITTDNPRDEEPSSIIKDILPGTVGCPAEIIVVEERREAIKKALSIAKSGDVVLLLGKGHETYQEVKGIKHHMDDREEVLEYFK